MQKVALPIAEEMVALAKQLETLGQAEAPWLQQVIQHWRQAPGKQIRPQCVFLVAGACGKISPKAHRAAALAALLHQASLVHDDVVDEATHRRGHPTVHARWGNKVAVLFGDHLLAKALSLVTQHHDYDLLQCLTEATQAMTQGELLQLSQAHQPETSEQVYLDIIHQKTAHLFGACFVMGALTAKAEEAQVTTLRQAGLHLGMAFQIRDDLNDYRAAEEGKPTGMDIREGKLTLPLIYALQQADAPTRQSIQTMIASSKPL
ncbi:MAG: polyprenyl synthetase family protein, partial [Bacteroidota bacterium]